MTPLRPWIAALAIVGLYALMGTLEGPDDIQAAQDVADDVKIATAMAVQP